MVAGAFGGPGAVAVENVNAWDGEDTANDIGNPIAGVEAAASRSEQLMDFVEGADGRGDERESPPLRWPATGRDEPSTEEQASEAEIARMFEFVEPGEWTGAKVVAGYGGKDKKRDEPEPPGQPPSARMVQFWFLSSCSRRSLSHCFIMLW